MEGERKPVINQMDTSSLDNNLQNNQQEVPIIVAPGLSPEKKSTPEVIEVGEKEKAWKEMEINLTAGDYSSLPKNYRVAVERSLFVDSKDRANNSEEFKTENKIVISRKELLDPKNEQTKLIREKLEKQQQNKEWSNIAKADYAKNHGGVEGTKEEMQAYLLELENQRNKIAQETRNVGLTRAVFFGLMARGESLEKIKTLSADEHFKDMFEVAEKSFKERVKAGINERLNIGRQEWVEKRKGYMKDIAQEALNGRKKELHISATDAVFNTYEKESDEEARKHLESVFGQPSEVAISGDVPSVQEVTGVSNLEHPLIPNPGDKTEFPKKPIADNGLDLVEYGKKKEEEIMDKTVLGWLNEKPIGSTQEVAIAGAGESVPAVQEETGVVGEPKIEEPKPINSTQEVAMPSGDVPNVQETTDIGYPPEFTKAEIKRKQRDEFDDKVLGWLDEAEKQAKLERLAKQEVAMPSGDIPSVQEVTGASNLEHPLIPNPGDKTEFPKEPIKDEGIDLSQEKRPIEKISDEGGVDLQEYGGEKDTEYERVLRAWANEMMKEHNVTVKELYNELFVTKTEGENWGFDKQVSEETKLALQEFLEKEIKKQDLKYKEQERTIEEDNRIKSVTARLQEQPKNNFDQLEDIPKEQYKEGGAFEKAANQEKKIKRKLPKRIGKDELADVSSFGELRRVMADGRIIINRGGRRQYASEQMENLVRGRKALRKLLNSGTPRKQIMKEFFKPENPYLNNLTAGGGFRNKAIELYRGMVEAPAKKGKLAKRLKLRR